MSGGIGTDDGVEEGGETMPEKTIVIVIFRSEDIPGNWLVRRPPQPIWAIDRLRGRAETLFPGWRLVTCLDYQLNLFSISREVQPGETAAQVLIEGYQLVSYVSDLRIIKPEIRVGVR